MDRTRRRARALRNQPTDAERVLWQHLRLRQLSGVRFRRQMPIGGYIADFACPQARLIVELDGGQHGDRQRDYDAERTQRLQALGWRVVRYWNHDVLQHTQEVLEDILRSLTPPQPSPSPAAKGRGSRAACAAEGREPEAVSAAKWREPETVQTVPQAQVSETTPSLSPQVKVPETTPSHSAQAEGRETTPSHSPQAEVPQTKPSLSPQAKVPQTKPSLSPQAKGRVGRG